MACFVFRWVPASAGMTWRGYCGELRASPCSLRSRPPSRSEGGEMATAGMTVGGVAVKGVLVVWVEMACFAFLWVPASAGMTWGVAGMT